MSGVQFKDYAGIGKVGYCRAGKEEERGGNRGPIGVGIRDKCANAESCV